MPATPHNCFICRLPWYGPGPICYRCDPHAQQYAANQPPPIPCAICKGSHPTNQCQQLQACAFCGGAHQTSTCLSAQLYAQKLQNQQAAANLAAMRAAQKHTQLKINRAKATWGYTPPPMSAARRTSKPPPYTNYHPLKACPTCKGNYLIESKAGSVCSSCKTVVHNPCRNCTSSNTRGVTGENAQFIECKDCLHIE